MFYHTRDALAPHVSPPVLAVLAAGNLAVDVFFVLSGFVLALTYAKGLQSFSDARGFLWRRLSRVYPLHALILTAFVAVAFVTDRGRAGSPYNLTYLAASFALVQNWGLLERLRWNVPAWSISTEWGAYLVYAAVGWRIPWGRLGITALIGVIGLLGVGLHVWFAMRGLPFTERIAETGLVRCLVEFIIGNALCALYLRVGDRPATVWAAAGVAAAAISWRAIDVEAPVVPIAAAATVLALACWRRGNPFGWTPLRLLGDWSYATYLAHHLVWRVFKLAFIKRGETVELAAYLGFAAALLLLSAMLYLRFEKPAQSWVRARVAA